MIQEKIYTNSNDSYKVIWLDDSKGFYKYRLAISKHDYSLDFVSWISSHGWDGGRKLANKEERTWLLACIKAGKAVQNPYKQSKIIELW